jgi:hypothetical protein
MTSEGANNFLDEHHENVRSTSHSIPSLLPDVQTLANLNSDINLQMQIFDSISLLGYQTTDCSRGAYFADLTQAKSCSKLHKILQPPLGIPEVVRDRAISKIILG